MKQRKDHSLSIPPSGGQSEAPPFRAPNRVFSGERRLARGLWRLAGMPPLVLQLWNGETIKPFHGEAVARLIIHNRRALWGLLRNPQLHFGDAYANQQIDIEGNLAKALESIFGHLYQKRDHPLWRFAGWLNRPHRNTLAGSRRNIHYHYDLGNDFYRLWLDREMVYTCAYFPDPAMTLEEAQLAKMDHVCRKLRLQPGETVVEAGCGWGSLARYMAQHYGVKVKAFNISQEQVNYARERAKAEGIEDRVQYFLDDYRNISGRCDAFVSVGLLEHVGAEHYRELGRVIDRCLTRTGRGLIHTIGRNKTGHLNAWLERRIFPGAYPPTLREMMDIFEPCSLSVLDVENLRLHYAKTLGHWLERFEQALEQVTEGYGPFFARAWRLYLAGSMASFLTSSLQLFQVVFARPSVNELPWTRAYLYEAEAKRPWNTAMS